MFQKSSSPAATPSLPGALAALTLVVGSSRAAVDPALQPELTEVPPAATAPQEPGARQSPPPLPPEELGPVDWSLVPGPLLPPIPFRLPPEPQGPPVTPSPPPVTPPQPPRLGPPVPGELAQHPHQQGSSEPPVPTPLIGPPLPPADAAESPRAAGIKPEAGAAPATPEEGRDSFNTVALVVLTVSAAFATLGKRVFVEIKDYFADFNNWLEGRSLLSGSVDVYTFHRRPSETEGGRERIFMELDSIARINMKELLEHRQAVKQFKRAADMCGPDAPFPSLNYERAATGLFWRVLSWWNGVTADNDTFRKRVDRELREEYSSTFASEIKRKMGGYVDERDVHVMIPLVEVWSEEVVRRGLLFGEKHSTTKRAELSFAVMTKRDFRDLFTTPEPIAALQEDNPRYTNKLRMLAEARRIDLEHLCNRVADGIPDIGLPPEHPDHEVRLAAITSFWPHIKVSEKNPKGLRGGNGH